MSRSGYSDDYEDDPLAAGRWRGAVRSAINGKLGQTFLRELAAALDAMPEKELAAHSFKTEDGEFCTLGVIANARGIDVSGLDPDDDCSRPAGRLLGIARALAAEIMYENDEAVDDWKYVDVVICGPMRRWERHVQSVRVPNEHAAVMRWQYMRNWVDEHLIANSRASGAASEGANRADASINTNGVR